MRSSSLASVHPRWRGEHVNLLTIGGVPIGSSPLARGTRIPCHHDYEIRRFIPAGAGNTNEQRSG